MKVTLSSSKRIFLGGTCAGEDWRPGLIKQLKIGYFNPVVEDWNEEAQANEVREREECDYVLYMITPSIAGVYSIFEISDDSNKRPEKAIFCFEGSFDPKMAKSLKQVGVEIEKNGAKWCKTLAEVAEYVNN